MIVSRNGKVVGEIALMGMGKPACMYEGRHGFLLYGFFPTGSRRPVMACCDRHLHTQNVFAGLADKVRRS